MKNGVMHSSARDLQTLFEVGSLGGLSDGQLLDRFVVRREMAVFEAVVLRHGPMVWGVCRRVLRDQHDAEDAFQATFLVLARKPASIKAREKLGNWLYGVAYQTAMKARATKVKRRQREVQIADIAEIEVVGEEQQDERLLQLDRELSRLPEKYRVPIVLCELEGMSHKEAAEQLGWPIGTVSCRLSRAKAILARRLSGGEVKHSVGSLSMLLVKDSVSASVPKALIMSTTRAATSFAVGRVATGVVSAKVAALAEGILKEMLMTKLKFGSAILMMVALGAIGTRPFGLNPRVEASNQVRSEERARPEPSGSRARLETTPRDSPNADEEMKKLEGTWAITDACEGGTWATPDQKENGLGRVVIKGNKMTMYAQNVRETRNSFDVDPSKSPKAIGIVLLNEKMEEEGHVQIRLGIYELKGDTLTICAGLDRPAGFEIAPGSKRDLLVLKWAKR